MVTFSRLAVLCASLAGITYAINSDGYDPVRQTIVNMKTTAIEQKNRLCPACVEAAEDVPGNVSLTLHAEQFIPGLISGVQFQYMYRQLVLLRYQRISQHSVLVYSF